MTVISGSAVRRAMAEMRPASPPPTMATSQVWVAAWEADREQPFAALHWPAGSIDEAAAVDIHNDGQRRCCDVAGSSIGAPGWSDE